MRADVTRRLSANPPGRDPVGLDAGQRGAHGASVAARATASIVMAENAAP
jgi:hypothetical protein